MLAAATCPLERSILPTPPPLPLIRLPYFIPTVAAAAAAAAAKTIGVIGAPVDHKNTAAALQAIATDACEL